jgi:hypothetical protein
MGKISYEAFQKVQEEQDSGSGVGFFSLKNDGDEAIVRIMHDSPADYDILSVHPIKVGDKYTKVECIDDNIHRDSCPMCRAEGVKLQYRFFVHMIQYVKDEQGNIVPKPVVWDRSAKEMSAKLNALIQEYGPLSDCVFKVRRNCKAGDMKTTYEIMFGNPNIYRSDLYPKDSDVFKGYSASGKQVMIKTADEMKYFLSKGVFPDRDAESATTTMEAPPQVTPPGAYVGGHTSSMSTGRPARYY